MTSQRQVWFWLGAVLFTALCLYVLRDTLMPFAAGLILAYLLDPVADRFERWGMNRITATCVILALFIIIFVLALVMVVPLAASQLTGFIAKMPDYIARLQVLLMQYATPLIERFGTPDVQSDLQKSLGNVVGQGASWLGRFFESVWAGGQAIVSIISLLVITPVVAFYLLVDWDHMVKTFDGWLPRQHQQTVRQLMSEIDKAISGFLRGQALVCVLLGLFYATALSLMGLSFGALIGMTACILSFIPFVGSIIGLLLSVGVACLQFWPDWVMPLVALGIFAAGQFIEGNILSPKLVGRSVGLHPVLLMFALLAFGSLFGFIGLLLAVPIAAVIGVMTRFALRKYLASKLYTGHHGEIADGGMAKGANQPLSNQPVAAKEIISESMAQSKAMTRRPNSKKQA